MSISNDQRSLVQGRAGNCCEYCRVAQSGRMVRFQVDHIIAIKHGGTNDETNLCLACYKCNGYKGSNVAALDPLTGDATKLYNPRQQRWDDHFELKRDATVFGLTPEGRATILVLRINDKKRVKQRQDELIIGEYPC